MASYPDPILPPEWATMSVALTTELERLIVLLQAGDPTARRELINRVYPRLHRLAAKILRESFPRLGARHDTSDITNEVSVRLYQALEQVQPASLADFFRLAAQRVRWILLDLAKKPSLPLVDRPAGELDTLCPAAGESEVFPGPNRWAGLHELIDRLPEEDREVVDLLFYHGLTEVEAAAQLQVSKKTVHRRFLRAKLMLHEGMKAVPGWESLFDEDPGQE
jgi:RNA polymerase sigma-70 factor (ECF subfamily)